MSACVSSSVSSSPNLKNEWNFYFHYCDEEKWTFDSYIHIHKLTNIEQSILLFENFPLDILKRGMVFIMKNKITPLWEDKMNVSGGCLSYRIPFKIMNSAWRQIYYSLIMNKMTSNKEMDKDINGISISPKKNFFIVKIWLKSCTFDSPDNIYPIEGLLPTHCIFKKHC